MGLKILKHSFSGRAYLEAARKSLRFAGAAIAVFHKVIASAAFGPLAE
jgi:hypothetical protein